MLKTKAKLLIFDVDGTLLDSTAHIVYCMQKTARTLNLSVPNAIQIQQLIGLSLPVQLPKLYPTPAKTLVDKFCDIYYQYFFQDVQNYQNFFADTLRTLKALKQRNYWLAIATGKSRYGLNKILEQTELKNLIIDSRCADETFSKPHPEMIFALLESFALPAEQAIMIGDSIHDMQLAANAKVGAIGITTGSHSRAELEQFQLLACVDRLTDLLEIL